jgi:hypothetical protein
VIPAESRTPCSQRYQKLKMSIDGGSQTLHVDLNCSFDADRSSPERPVALYERLV